MSLDFWQALAHNPLMPADKDTIAHLNAVLKANLTGINQYFLHARMMKHAGNVELADYEYKASIDAMKHADLLVDHILKLGGAPALQDLGRLRIGEETGDMLRNDLTLRKAAVTQIKSTVAFCEDKKDTATVAILIKILENQQEHIEFIRYQLNTDKIKECA